MPKDSNGIKWENHTLDTTTQVDERHLQQETCKRGYTSWSESDAALIWTRRLGRATVAVLPITVLLNMAALGFLSFLWYGGPNSPVWLAIMCQNWATRAITIPSFLIRTCSDLQAGVATAMVAALILEDGTFVIPDAAKLSIARASKPRPRTLLFPLFRKDGANLNATKLISSIVVLLLCITLLVLQFASTILLTDLSMGSLPGKMHEDSILYNLAYPSGSDIFGWPYSKSPYPIPSRVTTWRRNPTLFPAFAEYKGSMASNQTIDDTGVLLRAFLPFSDAVLRQTLRNYTGKAVVLDSRVSCQAPLLSKATARELGGYAIAPALGPNSNISRDYFAPIQINGTVSPTNRNIDKLFTPARGVPFSCVVGVGSNSTSVCQLNTGPENYSDVMWQFNPLWNLAGGMISEFYNFTEVEIHRREHANETIGSSHSGTQVIVPAFVTWGFPLLVLRPIESGPINLTRNPAYQYDTNFESGTLNPTVSIQENVPWSIITEDVEWHPWKVSASLCYTAWDIASLDVSINGDTNRKEPVARWTRKQHLSTIPSVTDQLMGYEGSPTDFSGSLHDRDILQLQQKDSWIPKPEDRTPKPVMPFVQAYSDVSGNSQIPATQMGANWTALMMKDYQAKTLYMPPLPSDLQTVLAENTLTWLFDHFMESSNNSIAHSLSALITVLSGMAYYDELPLFQADANVTQAFFTQVLFPQRVGGFWLIATVVLLHSHLIVGVTVAFLLRSKMSLVGSYWHTAIQLLSEDTKAVFAHGSMHTDKEVKAYVNSSRDHGYLARSMDTEKEVKRYVDPSGGHGHVVRPVRDEGELSAPFRINDRLRNHNCHGHVAQLVRDEVKRSVSVRINDRLRNHSLG